MARYELTLARSARRELERLDRSLGMRILDAIETLGDTPRPHGCRKLQGSARLWRIRVGEYRVVYEIDDDRRIVDVTVIRHRRDAYR